MRKTLKALSLGYVMFKVNGVPFATYEAALQFKNNLVKANVDEVQFAGFNILYFFGDLSDRPQPGWRTFYYAFRDVLGAAHEDGRVFL